MIDSINFDFGKAQIFKDFVVFEMFEGVHITPEHNQILEEIVEQYFKGRPFVYITHRKHSYSVDPSIYFKTSKIENLAGFAVVAGVPVAKANAEVEKLFLSKPFEIFRDIDSAIAWAKHIIDNKQKGITSS